MKTMKSIITTMIALCLLLGLTMCTSNDKPEPKPEPEKDMVLSTTTITLSDTQKAALLSVGSSEDWKSDLEITLPRSEAVHSVSVGEKEWLHITPAMGKAGITNITVSLIEEELPESPAFIEVKLESIDGSISKSFTVKYEPKSNKE